MGEYKKILYESNKILNYMIALTRLKPGEKFYLSQDDQKFICNYFKSYKKNYEFSTLIAISQFINNFDDDNTFPSEEILKDFFDNGIISYYDGSNDLIREKYNFEGHKGIEIVKDDFKGAPNEYELKFKFIRNALAHSDFEINNGQIILSKKVLGSNNNSGEFEIRVSLDAFLSLTEVLTEKRFSREGIDEVGFAIAPKHYVSIGSEFDVENILPLSMRKIIIKGNRTQKEKEEIKNVLGSLLYKNVQYRRAESIKLAHQRGEKHIYKVNDKDVFLNLENAFRQTADDLNHAIRVEPIKRKSKEIKYLIKYFKYYGDSFYNTASGNKNYARILKNDVILDILALNEKDRLNINYSSFKAREGLLKQKAGEIPFENLGFAKFEGLALLKNILISKAQLIFCQLNQLKEENFPMDNLDIIGILKKINITVKRNGIEISLFDKLSPLKKAEKKINGNAIAKENIMEHIGSDEEKIEKIRHIDESTKKINRKIYNYLDESLFGNIRNSITHGHMEILQADESVKLVFKDYKDEDMISNQEKRYRNRNKLSQIMPDFYFEIGLDDFFELCKIVEEVSFSKEDRVEIIEPDEQKISNRKRFFLLSPVKPMLFRFFENRGFITEIDKKQSLKEYTIQKMKQHLKDRKSEILTGIRF